MDRSKRDLGEATFVADTAYDILEMLDAKEIVRREAFARIRQVLLAKDGLAEGVRGVLEMCLSQAREFGRADIDLEIKADPEQIERALGILEELNAPDARRGWTV